MSDEDSPRYDRALRLLAQSLENLNLNWAAGSFYRRIAQERRNMVLVPDALEGIARLSQKGHSDEDWLITSFVAAEEFSGLNPKIQAYIDYQKGLDLTRRHSDKWASAYFQKIPSASPWAAEAGYVQAVNYVAQGAYPKAVDLLYELLENKYASASLHQKVERTLGRIAFEEERFEDALTHFQSVKEMAPDDPEILLEMGWAYYYMGNARKTLGLLLALDAPVHQRYIAPERFLLEALALRSLCQFGAARHAASRLERKYAEALHALSEGVPLAKIPQIYEAARRRGCARKNTLYGQELELERKRVESLAGKFGPKLSAELRELYARALAEATFRERDLVSRELDDLTEELLSAREGIRLIVHELGVALLRGRRKPGDQASQPMQPVPITGDKVYFPFDGEYWTDELDDYIVIAEDRCID